MQWLVLAGLAACSGETDSTEFGGGGGRVDQQPAGGDEGDGTSGDGGSGSGSGSGSDAGSGSGGASSGAGSDGGGSGASDSGDTGFSIQGTGYGEGDTAYDLIATDGAGNKWSLHAQYGAKIVLVVGNAYNRQVTDMLDYMGELDGGASVVFFAKLSLIHI